MYDYIIVGAGISGLYTAYNLNKNFPNKKICIIEASQYIGGRLHSIKYDGIIVDGGGARFNTKQYRVVSLVKELKLNNKLYPITNIINYTPINPNYDKSLEILFPTIDKFINYLQTIIKKYNISDEELINMTILDSVDYDLEKNKNKKIDKKYKSISDNYPTIKQYLIDIYPYYSELGVLNALEAINLFTNEFSEEMKYYCINGGMEQLAELIYNKLKKEKNVTLYKEYSLETINKINSNSNSNSNSNDNSNIYYELKCGNNKLLETEHLILAIPKNKLILIDYLKKNKDLYKNLNSIQNEPLYRIYARYPLNKETGKVWFDKMQKISTNLPIKYIIPINYEKGVIMISYTDSKFANFWSKEVINGTFEMTLNKELKQLFPDITIPKAKWFKHCPWVSGAGYWKKGYDRKKILDTIIQPLTNEKLYICGENYSSHQAWVEGALETANYVLKKLGITINYNNKNNMKTIKKIIKIKHNNKVINKTKKIKYNDKSSMKEKEKEKIKSSMKDKKNAKENTKENAKSSIKDKKKNEYTLEEVAKHNKKNDAWIVINNKVANITEWIPKHPGGNIIMKGVGKDATELFNNIGHSTFAKSMFKKYVIGIVKKV